MRYLVACGARKQRLFGDQVLGSHLRTGSDFWKSVGISLSRRKAAPTQGSQPFDGMRPSIVGLGTAFFL